MAFIGPSWTKTFPLKGCDEATMDSVRRSSQQDDRMPAGGRTPADQALEAPLAFGLRPVQKMNYAEFNRLVMSSERPVILVEGTRQLPEKDWPLLAAFAKRLAEAYPHAIFRTGNADGSDSAFAQGVAEVDARRLEYVLPYSGHRKKAMATSAYEIPVSTLTPMAEEQAAYHTAQASPEYEGMMAKRDTIPKVRAKARYLLRDTIKVIGADQTSLAPATVGIFYANPDDPMKGGTGHTIRVCQKHGVAVVLQDEWMKWPTSPGAGAE